MRKTIFIIFSLFFSIEIQASELEIIRRLEKNLSIRHDFTFKKAYMNEDIQLFQKVSISKCFLSLKTYSKNGLLFRDSYDLSKVKIHRKFFKFNGTYVLGFGLSSLIKSRLGLFFNIKGERDYYAKKYKRLRKSCHKFKYFMANWRKKRGTKNPPTFIGRIPQGDEETAGKVYEESKNIKMAHLYGEMSFLERYHSIDKAKKSIFIQSLLFRGDEAGRIIGEKLIKKRSEGIDIKIMVDGLASYYFDNTEIKTFKKNSHILYNNMMAAGIRVFGYSCKFAPFKNEVRGLDWDKLTHRNHDKVWLVDSETPEDPHSIGIVGGINFAAEYFRLAGKLKSNWRDHDVLIQGKILTDLRTAFLRLFTEKIYRYRTAKYDKNCLNPYDPLKKRKLYLRFKNKNSKPYSLYSREEKAVAKTSKRRILRLIKERISVYDSPEGPKVPFPSFWNVEGSRYIHVRPDEKEDYILKTYHQLIKSATSEILIANAYLLPSPEIIRDLQDAAERGVNIKIISNHANLHKLNMINLVGRSYYFDLKQKFPEKIKIFEWVGKKLNERGHSHNTMHSKYMVVDKKVGLVGSHNLDYSSQNNSETAIIFESDVLSEELSDYYNKLQDYSIEPSMKTLYSYKYPKGKDLILFKILKLIEHRL